MGQGVGSAKVWFVSTDGASAVDISLTCFVLYIPTRDYLGIYSTSLFAQH